METYEPTNEKEFIHAAHEYTMQLTKDTQLAGVRAFKTLIEQGKNWQWIYTALTRMPTSNWETYGFGLLFTKSYRTTIDNIVDEPGVDAFWDEVEKEIGE